MENCADFIGGTAIAIAGLSDQDMQKRVASNGPKRQFGLEFQGVKTPDIFCIPLHKFEVERPTIGFFMRHLTKISCCVTVLLQKGSCSLCMETLVMCGVSIYSYRTPGRNYWC